MRRICLWVAALAGIIALSPALAAPHPAAQDWQATVRKLPGGDWSIGNPQAPVMLAEYLSYTCPHCAEYIRESRDALLNGMVRDGTVRVETRYAVRNGLDIAASMLSRCMAADDMLAFQEAVFADQDALSGAAREVPAFYTRTPLVTLADVQAVAQGTELLRLAAANGLGAGQATTCLSDADALAAIKRDSARYWQTIGGTPAFAVNGVLTGAHDWSGLMPKLRAAGAE